jgi:hypothetical protein
LNRDVFQSRARKEAVFGLRFGEADEKVCESEPLISFELLVCVDQIRVKDGAAPFRAGH